jgi:hypothetical protein
MSSLDDAIRDNEGGEAIEGRIADALAARELTQAFLVRHGPTLIDPDKIAGKQTGAANFRHDLRAKLSLLETITVSLDKADQERREALALLADSPDEELRRTAERQKQRSEGAVESCCGDVPDVIDELIPEPPDIDAELTAEYARFLERMGELRRHLLGG